MVHVSGPSDSDREEPVDGPEDIAADGGEPGAEHDDFVTVHDRLRNEFPSALVLVYDDWTEHFAYYDQSTDALDAAVLGYLREQGFEILDAGRKECKVTGQEQAWLEVRRHDPGARRNGGDER